MRGGAMRDGLSEFHHELGDERLCTGIRRLLLQPSSAFGDSRGTPLDRDEVSLREASQTAC